ncbi:MAG: TRAP transporter fused permease subunit, partial [Treponemataceae bacterium]|nr:TRAP transporter fused permease subunit [Treponemataceae bacterium]
QFFIDICNAIAGGASGGPAKVAVLTSALLGTVSGSSVSNTVGSGSFTIPMMKKLGYKSEFAGAVEAAASTGGQLMPPIMGAAAFLMAESLGLPYITIVKAAIIPAVLYFSGIFITVHLEAKKLGLKGLPKEELPKFLPLLLGKGYMILPLLTIIVFLCMGKTAVFAALMGILTCLIIGLITSFVDLAKGRKPSFGFNALLDVICSASRNIISVAIACAMAGIIIGIVTLTGIGLKFGAGLISISHGIPFITLFLTMISSIILGMGAPTTANYLITSTITAGAIIGLGFEPLAAHMFAFYFGIIADITPPVALAALAGAAIAKGKPMATALNATKLAIGAFIIPYMFVFNTNMLLINASAVSVLVIIITSLIGMFGISVALEGYAFRNISIVERILFAIGGLLCVMPESRTDVLGLVIMAVLVVLQIVMRKRAHN